MTGLLNKIYEASQSNQIRINDPYISIAVDFENLYMIL